MTRSNQEIQPVLGQSARWLLRHQDASGGWSDLAGKEPSTLNTAEVILALLSIGPRVVQPGDDRIQRAVEFLLDHQYREGEERGAWPKERGPEIKVPDIVRSSFAIRALICAGKGTDTEPVRMGVDWILKTRNPDCGWGFRADLGTELMPTCFGLLALLDACQAGLESCGRVVEEGVELLVDRFQTDAGYFGAEGRLAAPHTIYAISVLQAARDKELSRFVDAEDRALRWLLNHRDEAKRLVEERFPIDSKDRGTYGFLYMTDALLIQILGSARERKYRQSDLAVEALISLKDKMQEDGGFYGYRTFSWSTAKAVSALCIARSEHKAFPSREPELSGGQLAGPWVFALAVVLALAMFGLSFTDRFGPLQAGVMAFLILALLVAYGSIGEKTFARLFEAVLDKLPWRTKTDDR